MIFFYFFFLHRFNFHTIRIAISLWYLVPLKYFSLSISTFHLQRINPFSRMNAIKSRWKRKKKSSQEWKIMYQMAILGIFFFSCIFHLNSNRDKIQNRCHNVSRYLLRYTSIHWHYSDGSFSVDKWFFELNDLIRFNSITDSMIFWCSWSKFKNKKNRILAPKIHFLWANDYILLEISKEDINWKLYKWSNKYAHVVCSQIKRDS